MEEKKELRGYNHYNSDAGKKHIELVPDKIKSKLDMNSKLVLRMMDLLGRLIVLDDKCYLRHPLTLKKIKGDMTFGDCYLKAAFDGLKILGLVKVVRREKTGTIYKLNLDANLDEQEKEIMALLAAEKTVEEEEVVDETVAETVEEEEKPNTAEMEKEFSEPVNEEVTEETTDGELMDELLKIVDLKKLLDMVESQHGEIISLRSDNKELTKVINEFEELESSLGSKNEELTNRVNELEKLNSSLLERIREKDDANEELVSANKNLTEEVNRMKEEVAKASQVSIDHKEARGLFSRARRTITRCGVFMDKT